MTAADIPLVRSWRAADERKRLLQIIQPALIGLIDGTISTLAPIFATAYIAGSHAALLVGLAAALGAAISMGMSEGLSDDGEPHALDHAHGQLPKRGVVIDDEHGSHHARDRLRQPSDER